MYVFSGGSLQENSDCRYFAEKGAAAAIASISGSRVAVSDTASCASAPSALKPRRLPLRLAKHRASYLHYVPKGVIGIISPWNFPFSIDRKSVV